jgi:hypothetical protein
MSDNVLDSKRPAVRIAGDVQSSKGVCVDKKNLIITPTSNVYNGSAAP